MNRLEIFQQVYGTDHVFTAQELERLRQVTELIVRECARIARNTDLEDIEGGDSVVLRAAGEQIQKHFGVEE